MTILEKYNSAQWHTQLNAKSQAVLTWYKKKKNKPVLGSDTETTGVRFGLPTYLATQDTKNNDKILSVKKVPDVKVFGLSLAIEKLNVVHLFWGRLGSPLYREMLKLFKAAGTKTFHNARYDIRACEVSNIPLNGELECTYTMSRIYWDRRKKHSLQKLGEILCPELSDWEEPIGQFFGKGGKPKKKLIDMYPDADPDWLNYSFIPNIIITPYAMTDAFMALMVYRHLERYMENDFHELYSREKEVFHIINEVEKRGLAFDIPKAKRQSKLLKAKMNKCLKKMFDLVGEHNPESWQQVLKCLLASGVTKRMLTLKGKLTTDVNVLRRVLVQLPVVKKTPRKYIKNLLEYRSYTKTVGTYLDPLVRRAEQTGGVIYCSINPADTRTGRMASRDPNLQNIPTLNPRRGRTAGGLNPVRSCFIVREGYTNYYFDYSQMELVIFGLLAQEQRILDAYEDGVDLHGYMASFMYGKKYTKQQRDLTKDTTYGKIYGLGVRGMSLMYGMSEAEAKKALHQYDKEFPSIRDFQYQCKDELRTFGYVEDWFGRRYHVPVGRAYVAVSAIVSGTCASIFKIALIAVDKYLSNKYSRIILPVHDEIQIERPNDSWRNIFIQDITEKMTNINETLDRGLRLRVDVSKSTTNWAEKKKMEM